MTKWVQRHSLTIGLIFVVAGAIAAGTILGMFLTFLYNVLVILYGS